MAQRRIFNFGDTLTQDKVKVITATLLPAVVYDGYDITVNTVDSISLSSGSLLLPNGVILQETSRVAVSLTGLLGPTEEDFTLVATHEDSQLLGGIGATYSAVSGFLSSYTDSTVIGWIRYPGGSVDLNATMILQAPKGPFDSYISTFLAAYTKEHNVSPGGSGGAAGSTLTIRDEGSLIDPSVTTINFTGVGVTASPASAGVVDVAVPSGTFEVDTVNSEIQPKVTDKGRSFVVGSQSTEDTGSTADDSRMFFHKDESSFRAGKVTGTEWDVGQRGSFSSAFGYNTVAYGSFSHAQGLNCNASGPYSHVEGLLSSVTPGANAAHAEGYGTVVTAPYGHAEGRLTKAYGSNSHVEGYSTAAYAANAHAEGQLTKAYGSNSHVEGYKCITDVAALHAHAEGYYTTAYGMASHAEGYYCLAQGDFSHAEGSKANAVALGTHAEGYNTSAEAVYSHAEGIQSVSRLRGCHTSAGNAFSVRGDGQFIRLTCGALTADATPTELTLDYIAPASDINMELNSVWTVFIEIIAKVVSGGGDTYGAFIEGVVKRTGTQALLVGAVSPINPRVSWSDPGASTWTAQLVDNVTAPSLSILVTGQALRNIRWVASVRASEIITA